MTREACFAAWAALLVGLSMVSTSGVQAGEATHGSIYLSNLNGPLYLVAYAYDGNGQLTVSPAQTIAVVSRGGGVRRQNRDLVYVVGAGNVSMVNAADGSVTSMSANNNANTAVLSPDEATLWAGWKDTSLASVSLQPLGAGVTHAITGDDGVATMIAFTPNHGAFYTTGGELDNESGNFGKINLINFTTQRFLTGSFATGINYDSFSNSLIISGLGRARQIDPGNPGSPVSSRDDSGTGENYLVLEPDGLGHLLGTRSGSQPRLVFIDYSSSGLIGGPGSILISMPLPDTANLSGGPALEPDVIFRSRFD